MTGQVYAVASGKGGVGKTTTVANLGVTLRARDHTVALVDADLAMPNLATVLGMDHEPTLHDVLADGASVEEALAEEADGFAVLPGSTALSKFADVDTPRLHTVVDTLAERYEYVLIDTGAGMSYEDVFPLGLVDGIVLVTSPDPSAVGDTKKTGELAAILDVPVEGVVITRAHGRTDAEAIAADVGVDLLGVIPDDPAVTESTADGRPLEAAAPDSAAAEAYRRLAAVFAQGETEPLEPPDQAGGTAAAGDPEGEPSDASDATAGDAETGTDDTEVDTTAEPSIDSDAEAEDDGDTDAETEDDGDDEPVGFVDWLRQLVG